MPVQVCWDNPEHTILRYTFEGHWTWNELAPVVAQADQMIDEVGRITPTIVDARRSAGFPHEASLSHLRQIISQIPSNLGTVVIVDDKHSRQVPIFRTLMGLVTKIYRVHWQFNYATSLDAAYAFIAARSETNLVTPEQATRIPRVES